MRDAVGASGHRSAAPPALGETLEFMRLLWAIDHRLQRQSKRTAAVLEVTGPQAS